MIGEVVGAVFGLILTGVSTLLGYGLLRLLRRTQRGPQRDCPNCGRPGGVRATPSGRGAALATGGVTVLVLLIVCGLPGLVLSLVSLVSGSDGGSPGLGGPLLWLLAVGATAGLGYAAIRYVNWYRAFPLVACACGWRAADGPGR